MTHSNHVYRTNPAERQRLQDDLHLLPPAVAGRLQLLLADFVTALTERRELIERVCWLESDNEAMRKQIAHLEDRLNGTYSDLPHRTIPVCTTTSADRPRSDLTTTQDDPTTDAFRDPYAVNERRTTP